MDRLAGKVAAVTGGTLGIGKATVERMLEEGAAVGILDILDDEGKALVTELGAKGYKVDYWHCDVADEAQVKAAFDGVAERFGKLDVVVNNAGIAGANKPTDQLTEEEWDLVQDVNVKGVFFCTKHAIPHMRKAGSGSIINLSSIYGLVSAPDIPPYHASKGAVRLMTKTDAMTYAKERIRVNSVHPGFIWTPLVEKHLQSSGQDLEAAKQATADLHPVGHMGEPDDIAWGIVYLASDESKFVTGSELVIDGGYTAH
ncbi:NAD(P)-dependent dehydrogenase, short-chain alcohol dehydrogenase family [Marinobacter persicus]|uniref:NAD(P)-dependent dehydrogenase, short-chain alcohol dehydrogenase family n=1 Tax=Marinobacter persicus TaxID=930118 RepID=A0A1I3W903_9GAMM|nr:glucose 1-dehydrogenase [Marinobacter persicus]GHD47169.1 2,5-dichloro-2,5-cyclohexadiene-1,4-diol dehydrogenase [Marinobacter persicus]SFK04134.1 NAD(P)-dependent dehydrogenase, short-chain alcohol dehydrogenase family [Marinobacter persicus]